jgi:hypothetical protein
MIASTSFQTVDELVLALGLALFLTGLGATILGALGQVRLCSWPRRRRRYRMVAVLPPVRRALNRLSPRP